MNLASLAVREPLIFVVFVAAFLVSLAIHEFMHAATAYALGDQTAARDGRLTLNPFAHVDPLGFVSLLFLGFGWGKPVPFNPYQLRWSRFGPVAVAFAGPLSNLILGFILALAYGTWVTVLGGDNLLIIFLFVSAHLNFALFLFNLIPVPPLDGSKALLALLDEWRFRDFHRWLTSHGSSLLLAVVLLDMILPLGPLSWISHAASRIFAWTTGQPLS